MFKQFINTVGGSDIYLITSLWIFLIFFVVVALLLIKMNKKHIAYMSELPLQEDDDDN